MDLLTDHQLCWADARLSKAGETYFPQEYARLYAFPVRRNLSAPACRDLYMIILLENSPTDLRPPRGNLRCYQIQVKCLSARKALPIDLLFHMEARNITRTMLTLTANLV